MARRPPIYGLLAEFENPTDLMQAAIRVRAAGYRRVDAYTPFPVEGLAEALGFTHTGMARMVLIGGLVGCIGGFLLQYYGAAVSYPLNVGGRPLFSWPAFIPITFEVAVLFAALGAVFGMLGLNRLPMHHHPLFRSKVFERVTDDAFFISIESWDPRFDAAATTALLQSLGARSVELVES